MNKKVLSIIGTVVLVISLLSGVWLVDDRYISAAELGKAAKQIHLRLDETEYRYLTEQYFRLKLLEAQSPAPVSEEIKKQVEEVEKQRKEVKEKIDATLREVD